MESAPETRNLTSTRFHSPCQRTGLLPGGLRGLRVGLSVALASALATGCASFSPQDLTVHDLTLASTPSYVPENVFTPLSQLSPEIQRVALLPIVTDATQGSLADGCQTLQPILEAELAKTKRFEVVTITPEYLQAHTGRPSWSSDDVLPAHLLEDLGQAYACQAVLFTRLTTFRGYSPLAVGWRMRLVEVQKRSTLWAADDVFDAGKPTVVAGARRYQLAELSNGSSSTEEWTILTSPRQFGQYATARLLATLPSR